MKYVLKIKGKNIVFSQSEIDDLKKQLGVKDLTIEKEYIPYPVYPIYPNYPHLEITC